MGVTRRTTGARERQADGPSGKDPRADRHGRPVAQLAPVPAPADADSLFGCMKGTMRIDGDVMAPLDIEWSALSGDEDHLYTDKKRPAKPSRKK
jgi:hypothetical protein